MRIHNDENSNKTQLVRVLEVEEKTPDNANETDNNSRFVGGFKMKFISQKQPWKKIVLAVLTTSVVAPLAISSAQAAPPDYAPAYGYRNKDEKKAAKKANKNKVIRDRDSDGYDDRDRDRDGDLDEEDGYDYRETPRYKDQYGNGGYNNGGYNNGGYNDDSYYYGNNGSRDFRDANRNGIDDRYENGQGNGGVLRTVVGVVTRDLRGRRFEMRSNNRTFVVIARNNEPLRLTAGDRVTVIGRLYQNVRTNRNSNRNNAFIVASRVIITRNDDQNQNGSRVDFTARVLDVRNDRELRVRAENGRTYTVRSDNDFNSNIDENDRVRVRGRLQNNVVNNARVELLNNGNGNDNDNDDRDIDFKGRVQSSSNFFGQRILTVRADNGTTYRVRTNENTRFDEGQRVRVRGELRNGVVIANDIDRI